jgi:hypothetical protein
VGENGNFQRATRGQPRHELVDLALNVGNGPGVGLDIGRDIRGSHAAAIEHPQQAACHVDRDLVDLLALKRGIAIEGSHGVGPSPTSCRSCFS